MRWVLAVVFVLTSGVAAKAQEAVPRDEALQIAFQLCRDLPKMLATPIATDPDVKRPAAVRGDNRGLLALPEAKLRLADVAQAGTEVVPVGQLWLLRLTPLAGGQPVKADSMQTVALGEDKPGLTPALCALGVRKSAEGGLELLVFGRDKQPLLQVPLAAVSADQTDPLAVSVAPQGDGAVCGLTILGRYTASIPMALAD